MMKMRQGPVTLRVILALLLAAALMFAGCGETEEDVLSIPMEDFLGVWSNALAKVEFFEDGTYLIFDVDEEAAGEYEGVVIDFPMPMTGEYTYKNGKVYMNGVEHGSCVWPDLFLLDGFYFYLDKEDGGGAVSSVPAGVSTGMPANTEYTYSDFADVWKTINDTRTLELNGSAFQYYDDYDREISGQYTIDGNTLEFPDMFTAVYQNGVLYVDLYGVDFIREDERQAILAEIKEIPGSVLWYDRYDLALSDDKGRSMLEEIISVWVGYDEQIDAKWLDADTLGAALTAKFAEGVDGDGFLFELCCEIAGVDLSGYKTWSAD